MACIFCDQTPETENAVEALVAIKKVLLLLPDATPAVVQEQVEHLVHSSIARDGVIEHEKKRRREAEMLCERYAVENKALQEQIINEMERRTAPPVYRGPSSAPSRGGGRDWGHEEPIPYVVKPNGKNQMFGMPYGRKSKKDWTK